MGPRNFQPVLEQCLHLVSDEMNMALMSKVTMEEAKEAVFQMGATKAPCPDGLNGQFYHHN